MVGSSECAVLVALWYRCCARGSSHLSARKLVEFCFSETAESLRLNIDLNSTITAAVVGTRAGCALCPGALVAFS